MADISDAEFRLSFNYPAKELFFDETTTWVRIRISDHGLSFKPLEAKEGSLSVELHDRLRGGQKAGKDVYIGGGGVWSQDLLSLLIRMGATYSKPFFILAAGKNGWFHVLHHFDFDHRNPPKFEPHMRVWFPRSMTSTIPSVMVNDAYARAFGEFAAIYRNSAAIVAAAKNERRIGRPSQKVREAQEILNMGRRMVDEICPHAPLPDMTILKETIDLFQVLIKRSRAEEAERTVTESAGNNYFISEDDDVKPRVKTKPVPEATTGHSAMNGHSAPAAVKPVHTAASKPLAGKPVAPRKAKPASKSAKPIKTAPAAKPVKPPQPPVVTKTGQGKKAETAAAVVRAALKSSRSGKAAVAVETGNAGKTSEAAKKAVVKPKAAVVASPVKKQGREKAFRSAQIDLIDDLANPPAGSTAQETAAAASTAGTTPAAASPSPEPEMIDGVAVKKYPAGKSGKRLLKRKASAETNVPVVGARAPVPAPAPSSAPVPPPAVPAVVTNHDVEHPVVAPKPDVVAKPAADGLATAANQPSASTEPQQTEDATEEDVFPDYYFVKPSKLCAELDITAPPMERRLRVRGMLNDDRRQAPASRNAAKPADGQRRVG